MKDTPAPPDADKRRLRRPSLNAELALRSILTVAAIAVPPAAIVFARVAGASWLVSFFFAAVAALAVYVSSRQRTTQEKAADLGRGVVVSLILTFALAWIQLQSETRSARESLSFSLSGSTSFAGIDLHGRNTKRVYLGHKNFTGADLRQAGHAGAQLSGSTPRGANLADADLSDADLQEADLSGASTNLDSANLSGANLTLAKLAEATLTEADLRDANLEGADLRGADLRDADLRGASLVGANLGHAILSGDLRDAVFAADYRPAGLAQSVLVGARWDDTTRWPAHFDPAAAVAEAAEPVASPRVPAAARRDRVLKVVDGDTIVLDGLGPVRLLGIDEPQTDTQPIGCFARDAAREAAKLLVRGVPVRYKLGVGRKDKFRDKFGRALVYVWTEGGRLLNRTMFLGLARRRDAVAVGAGTGAAAGEAPERHFRVLVVALHGLFAVTTVVLVFLAALGVGS